MLKGWDRVLGETESSQSLELIQKGGERRRWTVVFGRQPASSPRPTLTITDLTHRGKSNQRHAGVTRLHDIETLSFG